MKSDDDELLNRDDEDDEGLYYEEQNIYLHICREEGKQFAGLTTFHGMIRIFSSQTWSSLIFWSFVVVSCLVFYMVFSGNLLATYASVPTFIQKSHEWNILKNISVIICSDKSLNCSLISTNTRRISCNNLPSYNKYCLTSTVALNMNKVSILLPKIDVSFQFGSSAYDMFQEAVHMRSGMRHLAKIHTRQIIRRNDRWQSPCYTKWNDTSWSGDLKVPYSIQLCEQLRLARWSIKQDGCIPKYLHFLSPNHQPCSSFVMPPERIQSTYPCQPSCTEITQQLEVSSLKVNSNHTKISLEVDNQLEIRRETKKLGITDVLSLLGGGTSLFLGCSCVTLMETFVFLFKLVLNSLTKSPEKTMKNCSIDLSELDLDELSETDEGSISSGDRKSSPALFSSDSESDMSERRTKRKKNRDVIIKVPALTGTRKMMTAKHFRFWDEPKPCLRQEVSDDRPIPSTPLLGQLRNSRQFAKQTSHDIEGDLRKLPIRRRLTYDKSYESRYLRRQDAVDITDDEELEKHLGPDQEREYSTDESERDHDGDTEEQYDEEETKRDSDHTDSDEVEEEEHRDKTPEPLPQPKPSTSRSLYHQPASIQRQRSLRRVSSATSKGSSGSSIRNIHVIDHSRKKNPYTKYLSMNDF